MGTTLMYQRHHQHTGHLLLVITALLSDVTEALELTTVGPAAAFSSDPPANLTLVLLTRPRYDLGVK